jgi:AcrR family transcriptional regulator
LDLGSRVNERSDESVAIREKREQILEGAMQVFLSHGYAGTSMDRAASAAGVSKQTIYSHFQDKEGLFTAMIERVTIQRMQFDVHIATSQDDVSVLLRQLADAFLQKMADEEYLSLFRVVIAESVRFPELAQLYTRTVIQKGQFVLTTYFNAHPELNIADPEAIARIFWGSLVSFLISQEILYGKLIIPLEKERLINNLIALILKQET